MSAYRAGGNAYAQLASIEASAQTYSTRCLALLEADLRALALLALADWDATGLIEPSLFAALGALQKPSWGSWNFLVQSLRNARKAQLRGGASLERAASLAQILAWLDASAPEAMIAAARPLAEYLKSKTRLRRNSDVLTLPIALRNELAHFPPSDEAAWLAIRGALAPLAGWYAEHPIEELERSDWPAPWFLDDAGTRWDMNGVAKDFAVMYASSGSSKPREAPERAGDVARAFQRLLGQQGVQEQTFHRLFARLAPEDVRGVVLGDFLVGPPVARGGFAVVHVGRQLSTGRKVAIKLLHDGLDDDARLRFQQEAAFLSRLAHPSIVGVISHGEDAWSVPRLVDLTAEPWFAELARGAAIKTYIALEWIDGKTLEELFSAKHDTPVAKVRTWFRDAASALAAVHAAGLIHRDIKPGNLMVTADGEVRLMDFGIARSADENRTLVTSTGYSLGTPPYMSPEQLRARDADAEVGPASDVYSLCATFYELFTGERLFEHDRETQDSVRTRKLSGATPRAPRELVHGLPWELETILLGGLQAEIADRYTSAAALARDLVHWERDEPIEYRRPGIARRIALAYRRHRTIATIVAIALAILLGYGSWSVRRIVKESERADRERDTAVTERDEALAQKNQAVLAQARGLVATDPARALGWLAQLAPTGGGWGAARVIAGDALARPRVVAIAATRVGDQIPFGPDWMVDTVHRRAYVWTHDPSFPRDVLWQYDLGTRALATIEIARPDDTHHGLPDNLFACSDGARVVGVDDLGGKFAIVTIDLAGKRSTRDIVSGEESWRRIAACSLEMPVATTDDGKLWRWDAGRAVELAGDVTAARPTSDHAHAVSIDRKHVVTWWDLAAGAHEVVGAFDRGAPTAVSADGRVMVVGGTDPGGNASHYTLAVVGGARVPLAATGGVMTGAPLAISADGARVAVARGADIELRAGVDFGQSGQLAGPAKISELELSDDHRWLLARGEHTIVWDLAAESEYQLGEQRAEKAAFVGDEVVTWSRDGLVRVWNLPAPAIFATAHGLEHAMSPDHRWLVSEDGERLWRERLDEPGHVEETKLPELPRSEEELHVLGGDNVADSGALAIAVRHTIWRWAPSGAWEKLGEHANAQVLWSAAGTPVTVGGAHAREWTPAGPRELAPYADDAPRKIGAVTRDLRWLVATSTEPGGSVFLVDTRTRSELALPGATAAVGAFSDDGRRLVTGGALGLQVWDLAPLRVHAIATGAITAAEISPDGRRVAVTRSDGIVVHDVDTGRVHALPAAPGMYLAFDASGDRLVTATWNVGSATRIWDVESGEHRSVPGFNVVAATPQALYIGRGNHVFRYPDDLPAEPCALATAIRALGYAIDKAGTLVVGVPPGRAACDR